MDEYRCTHEICKVDADPSKQLTTHMNFIASRGWELVSASVCVGKDGLYQQHSFYWKRRG